MEWVPCIARSGDINYRQNDGYVIGFVRPRGPSAFDCWVRMDRDKLMEECGTAQTLEVAQRVVEAVVALACW